MEVGGGWKSKVTKTHFFFLPIIVKWLFNTKKLTRRDRRTEIRRPNKTRQVYNLFQNLWNNPFGFQNSIIKEIESFIQKKFSSLFAQAWTVILMKLSIDLTGIWELLTIEWYNCRILGLALLLVFYYFCQKPLRSIIPQSNLILIKLLWWYVNLWLL